MTFKESDLQGRNYFHCLLPVPPTTNSLFATNWKTKKRFKSKGYEDWEVEALRAFTSQFPHGYPTIKGRAHAHFRFHFSADHKRDIANFEKAITDFLVNMDVIEDDCLIDRMVLERAEKGNGVYVTIFEEGA